MTDTVPIYISKVIRIHIADLFGYLESQGLERTTSPNGGLHLFKKPVQGEDGIYWTVKLPVDTSDSDYARYANLAVDLLAQMESITTTEVVKRINEQGGAK